MSWSAFQPCVLPAQVVALDKLMVSKAETRGCCTNRIFDDETAAQEITRI